jgi:ribosome hibernation promoting factor
MKGKLSEGKPTRSRNSVRRSARKTPPAVAVVVTFRHVEPTPAIREYAERKLNHVGAKLKRGCSIHLILSIDKYRHQGEVTVKSGRFAMTAREETKDLYAVIDLLADKVSRQLKTNLAKVEARRVRAASTGEIMAAVEDSARESIALVGPGRF